MGRLASIVWSFLNHLCRCDLHASALAFQRLEAHYSFRGIWTFGKHEKWQQQLQIPHHSWALRGKVWHFHPVDSHVSRNKLKRVLFCFSWFLIIFFQSLFFYGQKLVGRKCYFFLLVRGMMKKFGGFFRVLVEALGSYSISFNLVLSHTFSKVVPTSENISSSSLGIAGSSRVTLVWIFWISSNLFPLRSLFNFWGWSLPTSDIIQRQVSLMIGIELMIWIEKVKCYLLRSNG